MILKINGALVFYTGSLKEIEEVVQSDKRIRGLLKSEAILESILENVDIEITGYSDSYGKMDTFTLTKKLNSTTKIK